MSDIDNMSQEDLEAALLAEINPKENGESDTSATQKPELDKQEDKSESGKKLDDDKSDGKSNEDGEKVDEDGNPYRKRIDRLLRKSSKLEEQTKTIAAEKDAEIARLKAQLENKTSKAEDDEDDETPTKKETVDEIVDRKLKERDNKSNLAKVDQEELDELFEEVPSAKNRKEQILKLADKHPTLSFKAIDILLAPEDHVDPIELNRKGANGMATGTRSKADLANEPDPSKMSTDEIKRQLDSKIKDGSLVL